MSRQRVLGSILALAGVAVFTFALSGLLPIGYDFYHYYWPIPRAWLAGETHLYDDASRGFYSPPWTLWLLLPFTVWDIHLGMAALTVSSLAMVSGVGYLYLREAGAGRQAWLILLLAAICPYPLSVLFVGTLDAWSLLGVYLSYRALRAEKPWLLGAGLMLALVRPQNAVLTAPVLLLALRHWNTRDLASAAVVPALVLAGSFVGFGLDWPLRWWQNLSALPPIPYLVTSTYAATNAGGIPLPLVLLGSAVLVGVVVRRVWQEGIHPGTLDLTVTANAVVSPYMLSQSYALLLVLPWARLALRRPWLAALPYAVTPLLLIRAQGLWDRLGLLDATFPIILLVLLVIEPRLRSPVQPAPPASREPVTRDQPLPSERI